MCVQQENYLVRLESLHSLDIVGPLCTVRASKRRKKSSRRVSNRLRRTLFRALDRKCIGPRRVLCSQQTILCVNCMKILYESTEDVPSAKTARDTCTVTQQKVVYVHRPQEDSTPSKVHCKQTGKRPSKDGQQKTNLYRTQECLVYRQQSMRTDY